MNRLLNLSMREMVQDSIQASSSDVTNPVNRGSRLNSTFDFSDPLSFDSLRVWAILFVSGVTRDYIRRKNFPGRLKSRPLDA